MSELLSLIFGAVVAFAITYSTTVHSTIKDCELTGKFRVGSKVFECRKVSDE